MSDPRPLHPLLQPGEGVTEALERQAATNERLRAVALAILEQAAVIITDASHMRVPRELVGQLRAALGDEQSMPKEG